MTDYIVVGDTETNGLDPQNDYLLEVAFLIADTALNVVAKASWLWPAAMGPQRVQALYEASHPKVQKMHTDNGLWQALYDADPLATSAGAVCDQIVQCFSQIGVSKNSQTELCGRNPNFDLGFLKSQALPIYNLFSYHIIDICSFQRFVGKTYGRSAEYKYEYGKPHRAIDDCCGELEELRYYRNNFMLAGAS